MAKSKDQAAQPSASVKNGATTPASNGSDSATPKLNQLEPRQPATADQRLLDLERVVGMEFIRATEAGALSAYKWMGKGDKESADYAACDAIRGLFDTVNISGLVTIGEGIKDDAPGIFKGEKLGTWSDGSVKMAIALDPIDGTTIVSKGLPGAICVMAAATCEKDDEDPNTLLADIPSFYMNKISIG